jgi:hypothetical protein
MLPDAALSLPTFNLFLFGIIGWNKLATRSISLPFSGAIAHFHQTVDNSQTLRI